MGTAKKPNMKKSLKFKQRNKFNTSDGSKRELALRDFNIHIWNILYSLIDVFTVFNLKIHSHKSQ